MIEKLELKLPPVVQVLICFGLIYLTSFYLPQLEGYSLEKLILSLLLGFTGLWITLSGVWKFKSSLTTVDPRDPSKSNQIVSDGIYSISRNPMYLGMLLCLIAWSVYLGSLFSLAFSILFVCYMTKFQILPEERILKEKFGKEYIEYTQRVRRWI
jgi:protein-S-isoprenylcysteine O-methyltransferase Ste14